MTLNVHVRYINILTWLQGFRVKLLYLVLFSLYSSLFWELRDKRNFKNLQFWPESLGAMLEYWFIERGLLLFSVCNIEISKLRGDCCCNCETFCGLFSGGSRPWAKGGSSFVLFALPAFLPSVFTQNNEDPGPLPQIPHGSVTFSPWRLWEENLLLASYCLMFTDRSSVWSFILQSLVRNGGSAFIGRLRWARFPPLSHVWFIVPRAPFPNSGW